MRFWVWAWTYLLFLIEAAMVVCAFGCACRFQAVREFCGRLARSRTAPLIAGIVAISLRLAVLPIEPVPTPAVHDEFSFLLAADTFAHGRLANPTHPMWQHFETMQIEHQPAYVSMYPPLQGMVLAAGLTFTGVAFAGVVLGLGMMCGAICWGLRGWFGPEWAFLGAMLAAMRLCMFGYWADSYWGGALAAAGGALLFGAVPRLIRRSRPRDAVIAAVGLAILANTRPYEGLAFSLAAGAIVAARFRCLKLGAVLPPFLAVLVAVGSWMAYYNWRAFGSPTTLPYTVNRSTYAVAPYPIFRSPFPEPAYRHRSLRDYYVGWELAYFQHSRTLAGYLDVSYSKLRALWQFFIGPALTLPLIACAWTWRRRRTRILLFFVAVVAAAMSLVPWFMPHYAAPLTVVIVAIVVQGLRVLRKWRPGVAAAIPAICAAMVGVRIAMALAPIPFVLTYPMTWATTWSPHLERKAITERLHSLGGRHLAIVRYRPGHDPLKEYVFNAADIDQSEIVWAHDMGEPRNALLVGYFNSRRVWLVEPDREPPLLTPYRAGE
jgi:hypothetical protein